MLIVVPSVLRPVLEWLYPPERVLFGLAESVDIRAEQNYHSLKELLWWLSGAATFLLLLAHIPAAAAAATAKSKALEAEADQLKNSDQERSLSLYKHALALTANRKNEYALKSKLLTLQPEQSQRTMGPAPRTLSIWSEVKKSMMSMLNLRSIGSARTSVQAIGPNGRYRLQDRVGHGGMGLVYRGLDTSLDRLVAIKGLPEGLCQEAQSVSRFHQEARALAFLNHPCIVQVYDLVHEKDRLWIILELVVGGDLAGHLSNAHRLSLQEAAWFGAHLADALHYAHSQGIVHRDFKPSNVLLTLEFTPKITDFGLARLIGSSTLTQSGTILGTPRYMSPEQASGHPASESSDAYAFGITLYELLTGGTPFDGDVAGVLAQHITAEPVPPIQYVPELPPEINDLALSLLEKDPSQRLSDLSRASQILALYAGDMSMGSVRGNKLHRPMAGVQSVNCA
jgi:hypothetical protein